MKKKPSPREARPTTPIATAGTGGRMTPPEIYADGLSKLTPEQRAQLRTLLNNPLFVHLMRIVESQRPSSNCPKAGSYDRDQFSDGRATARLAEMRGWDMHKAAIFLALNEPAQIKLAVAEQFQTVDSEFVRPGAANGSTTH